jgi:hypothetical protein
MRGHGRALFVAILLLIAGTLNVIYGIAAIGDSKYFGESATVIFSDLNTYGWLILILGLIELAGGVSLWMGHIMGRTIGLVAASLGAIGALVTIPDGTPFWSLGVFAICLICIHGLVVYEEDGVDRR